jgi:hypothetical protein
VPRILPPLPGLRPASGKWGIHIGSRHWQAALRAGFSAANLHGYDVDLVPHAHEIVLSLRQMSNLRSLTCTSCVFDVKLPLPCEPQARWQPFSGALASLTDLTQLTLWSCGLGPEAVQAIGPAIAQLARLRRLSLVDNYQLPSSVSSHLLGLQCLTLLDVSGCSYRIEDDVATAAPVPLCYISVRRLQLHFTFMGRDCVNFAWQAPHTVPPVV